MKSKEKTYENREILDGHCPSCKYYYKLISDHPCKDCIWLSYNEKTKKYDDSLPNNFDGRLK